MLSRKDTNDQAAASFEEDKRLARFFASDKVRRKSATGLWWCNRLMLASVWGGAVAQEAPEDRTRICAQLHARAGGPLFPPVLLDGSLLDCCVFCDCWVAPGNAASSS